MKPGSVALIAMGIVGCWLLSPPGDAASAPPAVQWEAALPNLVSVAYSVPALAPDGTAYVFGGGALYAITPEGRIAWSKAASAAATVGSDGTLYVAAGTKELVALASDGTQEWSYSSAPAEGALVGSPALAADGTIYVATATGVLHAVNRDGSKRWSFWVGSNLGELVLGPIGEVYAPGTDGVLRVYNPDGSKRWEAGSAGGGILGSDGTAYVSARDRIRALDAAGKEVEVFRATRVATAPRVISSDGTLYALGKTGTVAALHPNGSLRWTYTAGYSYIWPMAIGADGTVYAGGDKVWALSADGRLKWSTTGNAVTIGSDGTLYIAGRASLKTLKAETAGPDSGPWPMLYHDAQHTSRQGVRDEEPYLAIYTPAPAQKLGRRVELVLTIRNIVLGPEGERVRWWLDGVYQGEIFDPAPLLLEGLSEGNHTLQVELYTRDGAPAGFQDSVAFRVEPEGVLEWSVPLGTEAKSSPAVGPDGRVHMGMSRYEPNGSPARSPGGGGGNLGSVAVGRDGWSYVGTVISADSEGSRR
ncbi:MAG: PQQ-binding-like beta-propeller repeat protein [Deferrisomatales bacterium]